MDRPVPQKLRSLEAGNHAQHALLLRNPEPRLESHHIPHTPTSIFLAKLHDGVRIATRARIAEANRLERTEAKRVPPALGHHFHRHAPLEVGPLVELVTVILVG